jgi:hypothetical protein
MYVSSQIASNLTSESLVNLAKRAGGKAAEETETASTANLSGGSYDPSVHIGLSVDALLVLSAAREDAEEGRQTSAQSEQDNPDTTDIERRERAAYGHFLEEGDRKAYYRAYVEYFDSMPVHDQRSPRYAGTREPAVAALRAIAYNESALDMTAPGATLENAASVAERVARRATPIAAIFQPVGSTGETTSRVNRRISRADAMYSTDF